MTKVSEDQNEIEIDGRTYMAKKTNNNLTHHCKGCDVVRTGNDCRKIPCAAVERKDKDRKIFKLKVK